MWVSKAYHQQLLDRIKELEALNFQLIGRLLEKGGVPAPLPEIKPPIDKRTPEEFLRDTKSLTGIDLFEEEEEPLPRDARDQRRMAEQNQTAIEELQP